MADSGSSCPTFLFTRAYTHTHCYQQHTNTHTRTEASTTPTDSCAHTHPSTQTHREGVPVHTFTAPAIGGAHWGQNCEGWYLSHNRSSLVLLHLLHAVCISPKPIFFPFPNWDMRALVQGLGPLSRVTPVPSKGPDTQYESMKGLWVEEIMWQPQPNKK